MGDTPAAIVTGEAETIEAERGHHGHLIGGDGAF